LEEHVPEGASDIREVITHGKECCNVKVVETDDGLRIELTGDKVKEKYKAIVEKCCDGDCCADSSRSSAPK